VAPAYLSADNLACASGSMRLGQQGEQPRQEAFTPSFPDGIKSKLSLCTVGIVVLLIIMSFGNVEVTEYALCYSLLTRTVATRVYTSGRHMIGPFSYFVKFPAVLTTIQFSDAKMQYDLNLIERGEDMLRSRTKDGLDVGIELSFQYQLTANNIRELYMLLAPYPDYHNIFVRVAIDQLSESTTWFSATQFFHERTMIGKRMEQLLQKAYESKLFASVFSFQLRTVGLPNDFEEAIQNTEVMKQETNKALAEQNSTEVQLETDLMLARRRTKVLANKAEGQATSVMLANKADISQYTVSQKKAADSYDLVLKQLGEKPEDLVMYMQARVIRDHPGDKTMVGFSLPLPS